MRLKLKINLRQCYYLIVLISLVRIEALCKIPLIDTMYDALKIFGFVLTVYETLKAKAKMDIMSFLTSSLTVIVLLSALRSHNSAIVVLIRYLPMLTLTLLMNDVVRKKDGSRFLGTASTFFKVLLWLNFLALVLFPEGIYKTEGRANVAFDQGVEVYLLGKANALTPVIRPLAKLNR